MWVLWFVLNKLLSQKLPLPKIYSGAPPLGSRGSPRGAATPLRGEPAGQNFRGDRSLEGGRYSSYRHVGTAGAVRCGAVRCGAVRSSDQDDRRVALRSHDRLDRLDRLDRPLQSGLFAVCSPCNRPCKHRLLPCKEERRKEAGKRVIARRTVPQAGFPESGEVFRVNVTFHR